MKKNFVIAIDGPSGSGKSSVAKRVANKLKILYLDSGAIYRAITLLFLRNDFDNFKARARLLEILNNTKLDFNNTEEGFSVYLNNENVSQEIRTQEVTAHVSVVSEDAEVRKVVNRKIREFARANAIVLDGRDIGTVVFPDADLKVFLTASVEERARRRYSELQKAGIAVNFEDIKNDIERRDNHDSNREIAPLKQSEDAIFLDTTDLSLEQVVDSIIRACQNIENNMALKSKNKSHKEVILNVR